MEQARHTVKIILIFVVAVGCCFFNAHAQTNQEQKRVEIGKGNATVGAEAAAKAVPRKTSVKQMEFKLKDGTVVRGRLVSEDTRQVEVEKPEGSKIVVLTYSRDMINSRTVRTKNVNEAKYYMDLAKHFADRTWDFKDDPDDFIQAIRCYEKAKQLLEGTRWEDSDKIDRINEAIAKLHADREVWARETASRAKLKKLELEATIEARLKAIEANVSANSGLIRSVGNLNAIVSEMRTNYQSLQDTITQMNNDLNGQLRLLENRVSYNERLIDRISRNWGYYTPRVYPRRSRPQQGQ